MQKVNYLLIMITMGDPSVITAVVLSTQHDDEVSQEDLKEGVMEEILKPVLPSNLSQ